MRYDDLSERDFELVDRRERHGLSVIERFRRCLHLVLRRALRLTAMTADVLVPTSADEAASLFGDGQGVTVFGGGTILLPEITAGRLKPTRALMLHRSGLDGIAVEGDRVTIGAATPVSALVALPDGPLADFAVQLADVEIRATATIGGNLCAPAGRESQRGDLGAPLIALEARVRSTGRGRRADRARRGLPLGAGPGSPARPRHRV